MIRVSLDASGLHAKVDAWLAAALEGKVDAAKAAGNGVAIHALANAKVDTARFKRGIAEAANGAGLGPFAVPPINASSRAAKYRKRLFRQWRYWARRYEWYAGRIEKWYLEQPKRRRRGWYQIAKREMAKAAKNRDRAAEELLKFEETAILIGGRKLKGRWTKDVTGPLGRGLDTVRNKVYGGKGSIEILGDRVMVVLHNLEPHASIVENRDATMFNAIRAVNTDSVMARKIGNAYVKRLVDRAGAA